jgi:Bacterial membrane protein YfhO
LSTPVRPLLVALLGLAVLLFVPFFFDGRVLWSQDIGRVYYPVASLLREVLVTFDPSSLVWNPNLGAGFPLVADGVSTPFYPLHWPLLLLLPPARALTAALFLGYLGSALGMAAFARTLGFSRCATAVAGLAYAWCGFAVGHSVHVNVVAGLPFLPLCLLFLERATKAAPIRHATLAGMSWGLLCLGGHPQVALMAACLGVGYGLFRLWPRPVSLATFGPPARLILLFLLIGAGISAVYYLPMAELAGQSVRPESGLSRDQAVTYSLPWPHLVTAVSPFFFHGSTAGGYWGAWNPAEMALYVGLPSVFLAGAGLWLRRREPMVRFLAAVGAVALLLALGDATPLHGWVHALPVFRSLRAPARYVLLLDWAMALLAAFGLDALRAAPPATARRAAKAVAVAALVACGLPWLEPLWRGRLAGDGWQDAGSATASPFLLGFTWLLPPLWLALTALWLRGRPGRAGNWWPAAGVALVAADLASFAATSFGPYWVRPELVTRPDAAQALAASADPDRVYLVNGPEPWRSASDLPLVLGYRSLNAYVSLPLARHAAYLREFWLSDQSAAGLLDAAAVSHVVDSWRRPLNPRSEISGEEFSPRHFLVSLGPSTAQRQARWELAGVDADRLHLVTALLDGARLPQGAEVARVTLEAVEPGAPLHFALRAGQETAERLHDARTAHAQPATRLQAWSLVDRRSEGAFYLARFAWPEPQRLRALRIEYTAAEGRLLVFGGSVRGRDPSLVLSPFLGERYRRVREESAAVLYANAGARSRAFAVHRIVHAETPADAVLKVAKGGSDEAVVLEDASAPTPAGAGPSTARMVADGPTHVELEATMNGTGYVVLADTSYPGWEATVDGTPTPIYTANGLFRAVFVADGPHRLRFDYKPKALYRGLAVTLFTALAALGLVLARPRRDLGA